MGASGQLHPGGYLLDGKGPRQDHAGLQLPGDTLRGDEARKIRLISCGDSNSYDDIRCDTENAGSVPLEYGLISNDLSVKQTMRWYKETYFSSELTSVRGGYLDLFYWPLLHVQANRTSTPANQTMDAFIYDNANDKVMIRPAPNYNYSNDTVIQIDGVEERMSGHSQAQKAFFSAA